MKRFITFVLSLTLSLNGFALDVPSMLAQLQAQRLAECPAAEPDRSAVQMLQGDFAKVLAAAPEMAGTPLRVSDCRVLAQVRADTVVVSTQLAVLPERERLFVMAHELGHVSHADWAHHVARYTEYAGVVQTFDEVVAKMKEVNPEIAAKSRDNEFEADEYALQVLDRAGYSANGAALAFLRRYRDQPESETHPAIRERLERVRARQ